MPTSVRVLMISAVVAAVGFAAILITFGGGNSLSLNKHILNTTTAALQAAKSPNLTDSLTAQIAKEIVSKNATGPAVTDNGLSITLPNPDQMVSAAVQNQRAAFNVQSLRPIVNTQDISVAATETKDTERAYLQSLVTILNKRLQKNYMNQSAPEQTDFLDISKAYRDTMVELAAVSVPPTLTSIQLEALKLLGTQANAFALLSQPDQDPVKTIMIAQFQQSLTQEASALQQKVVSYIEEHGLTQ